VKVTTEIIARRITNQAAGPPAMIAALAASTPAVHAQVREGERVYSGFFWATHLVLQQGERRGRRDARLVHGTVHRQAPVQGRGVWHTPLAL
jgi:hypothetical protein